MVAIESAILVGPSDDERLIAIGGNLVARGTGEARRHIHARGSGEDAYRRRPVLLVQLGYFT